MRRSVPTLKLVLFIHFNCIFFYPQYISLLFATFIVCDFCCTSTPRILLLINTHTENSPCLLKTPKPSHPSMAQLS